MKTGMRAWWAAALGGAALLLGGCVTTTVAAEPASEAGPEAGPDAGYTDRAARLSYLDGGVRVALEGGSEWVEPRLNLPLAGGDRLRTDRDARVELRWDRGVLRLDGGSEAELDRMTDTSVRVWLVRGVAALRVRALDDGEQVAISTEAGVIEALRPGDYRVETDDRDGDALLIVRDGLAEFRAGERSYRVRAGEMLRLHRSDAGEARTAAAFARDGFDRWCEEREARIERSVSARYVPADMVGYEDLDAYGDWSYAGGFGYAWFPSGLAPGWTPYAFGSWTWISPWGWTWIDSSPWGYAPYHYGRWARYRGRWCWVPDGHHERPRYRPAPEGWRRERPIQSGDGHVYRPPLPPREAPARPQRPREDNRPREDRRISIPERPVNPVPPRGVPRTTEPPRTAEPPRTTEPRRDESRWTRGRPAADERDRDRQGDRDQRGDRDRQGDRTQQGGSGPQPERPVQSRGPTPLPQPAPAQPQPQSQPAPRAPAAEPDRSAPTPRWAPRSEPPRPDTPPVRVAPQPELQRPAAPVQVPVRPPQVIPRAAPAPAPQPAPKAQPAPPSQAPSPPPQQREREPRDRDPQRR